MTTTRLDRGSELGPLAPLAPQSHLASRYRIERFLEYRNGANLYRAIDEATGLVVIVKEKEDAPAPKSAMPDSEWAEQAWDNPWQNEFLILRSVSYPTVVKTLDIFKAEGRAYLILEQLEGRDLAFMLRSGQGVSVQQSLDWMIQLCQSIGQLHRKQLLHLDLQPRYVVVTPDGARVRLTGFHRAVILPAPQTPEGTKGYSPPEQWGYLGGRVDERSDIYALGALWHQMLTGNAPDSYWDNEESRFNLPDVSAFLPTIHPQIERIVRRMLQPDPDERYLNLTELKAHLLELINNPERKVGHCSDVGLCRQGNEDSMGVFDLTFTTQSVTSGLGLFAVADGMGGVNAGEIASALAIDTLTSHVQGALANLGASSQDPADDIRQALQVGIKNSNSRIYETGRYNPDLNGMGTTLTSAVIFGSSVFIGHVGDSRAYLINREGIEKVSRDHSLVGRLVEIGQITPEEAAVHPQRNLIYRSLGTYPNVEVDLYQRPIKIGDWLLLCSDGLTGHLSDEELQEVVLGTPDPHLAARRLVNMANQRGGEDNITVVLVNLAEYS